MTGKRTIRVHGEKIAKARAETKLDQESFARSADVSVRTLQRAEKSDMISPSKIAQIAGALRVNPEELIRDESFATSNRNDGYGTLILRPVRSYKDIQQLIISPYSHSLDLDYQINPQPEVVEKVAAVIKEIQGSIADVRSGEEDDPDNPPDYAALFRNVMTVTQNLVDLWDGGISVFGGNYTYRELTWIRVATDASRESFTHIWQAHYREFAIVRFFDDKDMAQNSEISERVKYGLSKSTIENWQFNEQRDIRIDGSTEKICADNQISSKAKLGEKYIPLFDLFENAKH